MTTWCRSRRAVEPLEAGQQEQHSSEEGERAETVAVGSDRRALLALEARPRLPHQGGEAGLLEASREDRAGRHLQAALQGHRRQQVAVLALRWTITRTTPLEVTKRQAQDKARAGTRLTRSWTPTTREVSEELTSLSISRGIR